MNILAILAIWESVKKFNTMCKETLQFPDFANLFCGGGFSYASRLEAIFDLFMQTIGNIF